jgi:hypothetical protein
MYMVSDFGFMLDHCEYSIVPGELLLIMQNVKLHQPGQVNPLRSTWLNSTTLAQFDR